MKQEKQRTVLIAGGTGLLGRHLSGLLADEGFSVIHLSRKPNMLAQYPAYRWDVSTGYIDDEALERAGHIVNLAGAGVADQRWTPARKQLIHDSRVNSTRLLRQYLEKHGIGNFCSYAAASAIGYYGNRGEEWLAETSMPGDGFLPQVCKAWEQASGEIASLGLRTTIVRIGLVLSMKGGALPPLLLPFRFLVGTYFGSGRQWYSWIHIDDICNIFLEAIKNESMEGIYNGVAPNPVRNCQFVATARQALERPALLMPVPEPALRLVLGEMANAVLDSTRVSAEKLQSSGFAFRHEQLLPALQDLLRRRV